MPYCFPYLANNGIWLLNSAIILLGPTPMALAKFDNSSVVALIASGVSLKTLFRLSTAVEKVSAETPNRLNCKACSVKAARALVSVNDTKALD